MKIAVPYENGEICSHLAQVKEFLIFDVVDDEIISTKTVKQTYANDPGALVEFLKKENTAVLLCDALPIPMMIALRETSIQVLGGAKGAPKDRVEDFTLTGAEITDHPAASTCRTTIKMALTPTPNATEISVPVGLGATNSCFI